MAKTFSDAEWAKILRYAEDHAGEFGLPERRAESVVMGSFNIRKLGEKKKKSDGAWKLLEMTCDRFDLIAIQEVQDNLDGIKYLRDQLGGAYGLVASDVTGIYPGERGNAERLAFLFRWKVVRRTEIASDITYDRTRVANTLFRKRDDFQGAYQKHAEKLNAVAEHNSTLMPGEKKKTVPAVPHPHFITFIRQPLCVSFEVGKENARSPYEFLAVNCHLLYGKIKDERKREFEAIISWLIDRAQTPERMYYKNILFMGDCNLDFDDPETDRPRIDAFLKSLNDDELNGNGDAAMNFPFLDAHPGEEEPVRTNARLAETYDQIALVFRDDRLPGWEENESAGETADGYDFGVFNFVEMFAQALYGKSYQDLSKSDKKKLIRKFEHDVTDHLPIWIRLPLPK